MSNLLLIFLALVFAHLLADYPLQGDFLAQHKGKNPIILIVHSGIWTGCITIAGILMGLNIGVLSIFSLFVIHAIADYLKSNSLFFYKNLNPLTYGLFIDQSIHMLQIIILIATTLT